ncbi:MAG: hypothetical protein IPI83_07605 [Sphingomonadales bacterium]|nr:hypothetical protein [Sphingomonadales bacterium]
MPNHVPNCGGLPGGCGCPKLKGFVAQAAAIKGASPHPVDHTGVSGALLAESLALMEELDAVACG